MAMSPEAIDRMLKNLLEKDLRVQCRARGLSPAGGKDTLRERVKENMLETEDYSLKTETGDDMILASNIAGTHSEEMTNNYARPGGQQNVGNFITDKPSSRVLQAPGGGSQISFGGDVPVAGAPGSPKPPASPVYQEKSAGTAAPSHINNYHRGTSQNIGNFITDRSSTRVAAPPGGASSIVFG